MRDEARRAVARAQYGSCDYWHALDAMYDTLPDSPLHHDNRCIDCREYVDDAVFHA